MLPVSPITWELASPPRRSLGHVTSAGARSARLGSDLGAAGGGLCHWCDGLLYDLARLAAL